MLPILKEQIKRLIFNNPVLFRLFLRQKFPNELRLIKGRPVSAGEHPSIIHFSLNKAATQHTKSLLRRMAKSNGLVPIHINEYAFFTEFPYLTSLSEEQMAEYKHIFRPKGFLYSAFGGFVRGIDHLKQYKVLLMVRDPRDVLVSWYYSLAFSHSIPPETSDRHEEYLENRKSAREMTIDEHVLAGSDRVYTILDTYRKELLEPYPHVTLTSYEEMTSDYETWLRKILDACQLTISDAMFQELLEENRRLQPKKENKHQHIRKGKPGDYRDKLQPETIAELNTKFKPIFAAYQDVLEM
jgi:hypothetical protein